MKRRLYFYLVVACLTVINSFLLASPNLLGRIGLFIYHYRFLTTFPRTLITVSMAVIISVLIAEFIALLVKNRTLKKSFGVMLLLAFAVLCGAALYKTILDFTAWSYAHTGQRFRYGAYLLPCLLMLIFAYRAFDLPVRVEEEIPVDNKTL